MAEYFSDPRVVAGAIVLAVLVLLLALMLLGWRLRQRRQAAVPRPKSVPDQPGDELIELEVMYVATTIAGEPLNRLAVAGLGYRARARVAVRRTGIVLSIPGEPDAFIPAADISRVDRATWTIDRVVEREGLVRIAWTLGDTPVDSYLRVTEPADPTALISALMTIFATSTDVRNEEK